MKRPINWGDGGWANALPFVVYSVVHEDGVGGHIDYIYSLKFFCCGKDEAWTLGHSLHCICCRIISANMALGFTVMISGVTVKFSLNMH